jgi:hypothetical protein
MEMRRNEHACPGNTYARNKRTEWVSKACAITEFSEKGTVSERSAVTRAQVIAIKQIIRMAQTPQELEQFGCLGPGFGIALFWG